MSKKIFSIIALGATLCVQAQKDSTKGMDEVVVTATKFPIKTSATGKVITIITKEQLEKAGGKDLSQMLNEQTGIQINGANSNPGKDKSIYVRGANYNQALITIDGVPMYDPTSIGSAFDIRNISIDMVERIEILKGSQSTLYGSDAVAGVINIITKKGSSKKNVEVAGNASYGHFNNIKGNVNLLGKLSNFSYNAGYSYHKTDGINEATDNTPNADKDGIKQEAFNANFGYQVSKNISLKPFLRYTWVKGDLDGGAFLNDNNNTYNQKSFNVGTKAEFIVNKSKINFIYSFNKIDRNSFNDSVKGIDPYFSRENYKGKEHFAELNTNIELSKNVKLTVGADYRASDIDLYDNYGGWESFLKGDSIKHNQIGAYAALNYSNLTNFNLEVGTRVNTHSIYGSNMVYNINPSYNVTDDIKVLANFSTGFKTPSLYQLFTGLYGNKNLKPETSTNFELGLQHYFADKKVNLQVVFFRRNINDLITFNSNSVYDNINQQKDLGMEFEFLYKCCKNFTAKLSYTYVEGLSIKDGDKDNADYKNALLRRPNHIANLNLGYQITPKFFMSTNLQFIGRKRDVIFVGWTPSYVNVNSYALLDVYAEYKINKRFTTFVNGRNLTNPTYTEILGYNTIGINVNGGLRFNF